MAKIPPRKAVPPPQGERVLDLRDAIRLATGRECRYTSAGLRLWVTRGLLDEKGERCYLEAIQVAGVYSWQTSVEAVRRFLEAVGNGRVAACRAALSKGRQKQKQGQSPRKG